MRISLKAIALVAGLALAGSLAFAAQANPGAKPAPTLDEKAPRLLATRLPAKDDAKKFLLPETKLEPAALEKANLRVVPLEGSTALVDEAVLGQQYAMYNIAQFVALSQVYARPGHRAKLSELPKGSADALRRGLSAIFPRTTNAVASPDFEVSVAPSVQAWFKDSGGTISACAYAPSETPGAPDPADFSGSPTKPAGVLPTAPGSLDEVHLLFQKNRWTRVNRTRAARLLMEWIDDQTSKLDEQFKRTSEAFRMAMWNDHRDMFGATPPVAGQGFGELDPRLQRTMLQHCGDDLKEDERADAVGRLGNCRLTATRIAPNVVFYCSDKEQAIVMVDLVGW